MPLTSLFIMAHISRARKPKLDEKKLNLARKQVFGEYIQQMNAMFNKTRNATAAEAKKDAEQFKKTKGDYKPLGTFSFDEMIFCQQVYGKEITSDPDFWRFWRKANGQGFLNFL